MKGTGKHGKKKKIHPSINSGLYIDMYNLNKKKKKIDPFITFHRFPQINRNMGGA